MYENRSCKNKWWFIDDLWLHFHITFLTVISTCHRISFTYSRVCRALGIRSASASSDLTTASSPCSQCTVAFRTKAHHRLTGSPTGGQAIFGISMGVVLCKIYFLTVLVWWKVKCYDVMIMAPTQVCELVGLNCVNRPALVFWRESLLQ